MGWRNLQSWLKGGIIGIVTGFFISSLFAWGLHNSLKCAYQLNEGCGLEPIEVFYIISMGSLVLMLVGVLIGFIFGKIKSKNNKK